MIAAFLWGLYDKLILWLAQLNPTAKAKVDELQAKVAEQEARREKLLAQVEAGEAELVRLGKTLAENGRKRIELENANLHAKEAAAAKIAELDDLRDGDRVRVDL